MSNLAKTGLSALLLTALIALGACEPAVDNPVESGLDMSASKIPEGQPYRPDLLSVSAIGRVETAPDIAIVTGTIELKEASHNEVYAKTADIINQVQAIADTAKTEMSYTDITARDVVDEDCQKHNSEAAQRHREILANLRSNRNNQRQIETLQTQMERNKTQYEQDISGKKSRLTKLLRNRDIPEFRREIFSLEEQIEQVQNRYRQNLKNNEARLTTYEEELATPKPRIAQKVCEINHVKGRLSFTARINPAEKAPDFMNQFTQAGVTDVNLFGYDFSDYDSVYRKATELAVANAREKAELIAGRSGTHLKKVKAFSVSQPTRFGRFGPQSRAIVSQPRYANTISIPPEFESYMETVVIQPQSVEYVSVPPTYETVTESVVVQEATSELVTVPATYKTVTETIVIQPAYEFNGHVVPAITEQYERRVIAQPARTVEKAIPATAKQETRRVIKTPASTTERVIPAVTKQIVRRRLKTPARTVAQELQRPQGNNLSGNPQGQNNRLRSSVLSGPQTVEVSALLVFDYATALDGVRLRVATTP